MERGYKGQGREGDAPWPSGGRTCSPAARQRPNEPETEGGAAAAATLDAAAASLRTTTVSRAAAEVNGRRPLLRIKPPPPPCLGGWRKRWAGEGWGVAAGRWLGRDGVLDKMNLKPVT